MKNTIAIIVALLLATVANAGPFGYEMGQKIEGEPDGQTDDGLSYITVESPPNPFDTLMVYYTEQTGLCQIRAFIDVDETADSYGYSHREKTDWLAEQIEAKYGKPTSTFDFLHAGSIWKEPKYWLMSLRKNERSYSYHWGESVYPDDIGGILVRSHFGFVMLGYHFTNLAQCVSDAEGQLQNTL